MSAIAAKSGVCGRFKLEAKKLDVDGNVVSSRLLADWFDNLITDQGLNYMGATGGWLSSCQVGTGTAAPAVTDTALAAYLAGTNTFVGSSSVGAAGSAPYYAYVRITYRFGTGVAAGNLSEVGIGLTTTTGNLYSRALILDGGGSPTTITVLADEVLDVTYEHRTYPPTADVVGNITISGVNYSYVLRASSVTNPNTIAGAEDGWGQPGNETIAGFHGSGAEITAAGYQFAYSGGIGTVVQSPSGLSDAATSVSSTAYSNNSLVREGKLSWGLSDGNLGGVKSVRYSFKWCTYQIEFTPAIPKDGTKILELTFQHAWTRAVIP